MDIRQIEYFIAAAQRGNFTKAAEDLFITRQALSKAVRNLEHETGLTLMDNKDGRLELTAEGRMLFDDAEPVVAAYRNLEERYANTVKHPPVRHTIDAFCMDHPDVLLSVEEVTTEAALGMARSGESDISLVGSAPPYLGGFDLMLVVETGTYVFVPRESPLAARKRLAAADIEGQPFVTFGKRNHLHRFFVETCEAAGVKPNIIMTTSDAHLLVRTAEQQQACYFGFPPHIELVESPTHVLVPLDLNTETVFGTYAVKRQGAALSSSARAFWDFLAKV